MNIFWFSIFIIETRHSGAYMLVMAISITGTFNEKHLTPEIMIPFIHCMGSGNMGALDGGAQCRMSILRNGNFVIVAYFSNFTCQI